MRITGRITSVEARHGLGRDPEGKCRYCTGRHDLIKTVVFDQYEDGPVTLRRGQDATPNPCPRCGKDLKVHIVLHRVDPINRKRKEMGLSPTPAEPDPQWRCGNRW